MHRVFLRHLCCLQVIHGCPCVSFLPAVQVLDVDASQFHFDLLFFLEHVSLKLNRIDPESSGGTFWTTAGYAAQRTEALSELAFTLPELS